MPNPSQNNPYAILNLPADITDRKAIKRAYLNLAAKFHPDKNRNAKNVDEFTKKMQELTWARDTLLNDKLLQEWQASKEDDDAPSNAIPLASHGERFSEKFLAKLEVFQKYHQVPELARQPGSEIKQEDLKGVDALFSPHRVVKTAPEFATLWNFTEWTKQLDPQEYKELYPTQSNITFLNVYAYIAYKETQTNNDDIQDNTYHIQYATISDLLYLLQLFLQGKLYGETLEDVIDTLHALRQSLPISLTSSSLTTLYSIVLTILSAKENKTTQLYDAMMQLSRFFVEHIELAAEKTIHQLLTSKHYRYFVLFTVNQYLITGKNNVSYPILATLNEQMDYYPRLAKHPVIKSIHNIDKSFNTGFKPEVNVKLLCDEAAKLIDFSICSIPLAARANSLLLAGLLFQFIGFYEVKTPEEHSAYERLALLLYQLAMNTAYNGSPALQLYITLNALKAMRAFAYQHERWDLTYEERVKRIEQLKFTPGDAKLSLIDESSSDTIKGSIERLIYLIDLFPVPTLVSNNINCVYTHLISQKYLHATLTAIVDQPDKSLQRDANAKYHLYENALMSDEDATTIHALRRAAIYAALVAGGSSVSDVNQYVHYVHSMLPRDLHGFIAQPATLNIPLQIESFISIEGAEIDKNGKVKLSLIAAEPGKPGVLTRADIMQSIEYGVTYGLFSLDHHNHHHPRETLQIGNYQPENIYGTYLLKLLVTLDLFLKYLVLGKQVSGHDPYDIAEIENMIAHLPESLRKILTMCHRADRDSSHRVATQRRLWFHVKYVEEKQIKTNGKTTIMLGDVKIEAKTQLMRRNAKGELVDDHEIDDSQSIEQLFVREFTQHYEEISHYLPIFARLKQMARLGALVNFFLMEQSYSGKILLAHHENYVKADKQLSEALEQKKEAEQKRLSNLNDFISALPKKTFDTYYTEFKNSFRSKLLEQGHSESGITAVLSDPDVDKTLREGAQQRVMQAQQRHAQARAQLYTAYSGEGMNLKAHIGDAQYNTLIDKAMNGDTVPLAEAVTNYELYVAYGNQDIFTSLQLHLNTTKAELTYRQNLLDSFKKLGLNKYGGQSPVPVRPILLPAVDYVNRQFYRIYGGVCMLPEILKVQQFSNDLRYTMGGSLQSAIKRAEHYLLTADFLGPPIPNIRKQQLREEIREAENRLRFNVYENRFNNSSFNHSSFFHSNMNTGHGFPNNNVFNNNNTPPSMDNLAFFRTEEYHEQQKRQPFYIMASNLFASPDIFPNVKTAADKYGSAVARGIVGGVVNTFQTLVDLIADPINTLYPLAEVAWDALVIAGYHFPPSHPAMQDPEMNLWLRTCVKPELVRAAEDRMRKRIDRIAQAVPTFLEAPPEMQVELLTQGVTEIILVPHSVARGASLLHEGVMRAGNFYNYGIPMKKLPVFHVIEEVARGEDLVPLPKTELLTPQQVRALPGEHTLLYVITEDKKLSFSRAEYLTPRYVETFTGETLPLYQIFHPEVSQLKPVLLAGEIKVKNINGEFVIEKVNNMSGHFQPHGPHLEDFAETIFQKHGFDIEGKFEYIGKPAPNRGLGPN
ncbi:MAG: hypothetical protein Tsb005_12550 [Gammaproteobacteria bacterium]